MRTHHFFFAVFLSCFLVFGQAHAGWVPVATVNEKTPGHLCDVDDNGLDLFCGGNNPQLLANGGISSTSISTTVINFEGVTATSVLGAGGNFIVSGTTSVSASNAGTIKFATAGSERMVIDGNGRVGIGASSPAEDLHISSDGPGILLFDTNAALGAANPAWRVRSKENGRFALQSTTDYSSYTNRIAIDIAGNVGIGVINPSALLHVDGGAAFNTKTNSTPVRIVRDNNAIEGANKQSLDIGVEDSIVMFDYTNDEADSAIVFRIQSTDMESGGGANASDREVMRMTSNASNAVVGIGDSTPDYTLDVEGTAYATGAAGALSDRRHKKAITDLPVKGLETITKLRPVQFEWKDPRDAGMEGAQFGFIAQEVEEVLPQVILTQDDEEQTKGMKPTALIPVLTKAIQEQNAEINALKAENAAFRQELDNLKQMLEAR